MCKFTMFSYKQKKRHRSRSKEKDKKKDKEKKQFRKKHIGNKIRDAVWKRYGPRDEKGNLLYSGKCWISWCNNIVDAGNFSAAHNIPERWNGETVGKVHELNIYPCCDQCNRQMGNEFTVAAWDVVGNSTNPLLKDEYRSTVEKGQDLTIYFDHVPGVTKVRELDAYYRACMHFKEGEELFAMHKGRRLGLDDFLPDPEELDVEIKMRHTHVPAPASTDVAALTPTSVTAPAAAPSATSTSVEAPSATSTSVADPASASMEAASMEGVSSTPWFNTSTSTDTLFHWSKPFTISRKSPIFTFE